MRRLGESPRHGEGFGYRGEVLPEICERDVEVFRIEFHAHQEETGFLVTVLISVQYVPVMTVNEVGDSGDFALTVRARDEQDGGVLHCVDDPSVGERDVASNVTTNRL
jgi:hypothetical protein